jgi:hypothetical protein
MLYVNYMDKNEKLIIMIFIGGLLLLLWNATSGARHRDICEGMTPQQCQAYSDSMSSRGDGWSY